MDTQVETGKLSSIQKEILSKWQKKQKVAITQEIKDLLQIKFDGEVLFDEPMTKYTYIKIGGPAEIFLRPASQDAIVFAQKLAHENQIPLYFHGAGANTLVKDGGIKGMVMTPYTVLKDFRILEKTDDYLDIYADSGTSFNSLIRLAKDEGMADLTPFVGIPGSVGGFISMNAGTRLAETKDILREVTFLTKEGEVKTIACEDLEFEYRHLKIPKNYFILNAVFRLTDFASPEEIEAQMKRHQERRAETQPLDYPNLGSIFRNPKTKEEAKDVMLENFLLLNMIDKPKFDYPKNPKLTKCKEDQMYKTSSDIIDI